jgi:hypothetical protein
LLSFALLLVLFYHLPNFSYVCFAFVGAMLIAVLHFRPFVDPQQQKLVRISLIVWFLFLLPATGFSRHF